MISGSHSLRNFLVIFFSYFSRFFIKDFSIRVLALHDIDENESGEFKRKILWLKQNYNVVSLSDAYKKNNLSKEKINIVITFDDGFKCFHSVIAPVFTELNLPATFFICSGVLDLEGDEGDNFTLNNLRRKSKKFDYLTTGELQLFANNSLFEIGGHTKSHIDLGQSWDKETLEKEIKQDKEKLESVIGKKINFFAYPFGSITNMSKESEEVIKNSGYLASFSILPSFWKNSDNIFRIGRDSLTLHESDRVWEAWLYGGYDSISFVKNFFKK